MPYQQEKKTQRLFPGLEKRMEAFQRICRFAIPYGVDQIKRGASLIPFAHRDTIRNRDLSFFPRKNPNLPDLRGKAEEVGTELLFKVENGVFVGFQGNLFQISPDPSGHLVLIKLVAGNES